MSLLSRLFGKGTDDRADLRPLWHRIVALAREPQWYAKGGIADTLAGRFDAVTMVLALVMLRMERDSALMPLSARLTELFVEDMDGQLREGGVGDLAVGKRMGKLMGTLGGRIGAYREGLAADNGALADAAARNITMIEGADPANVAREMRVLAGQLDAISAQALLAGEITR
jgi:cytochrome b pre-mRNA-processing protein 3